MADTKQDLVIEKGGRSLIWEVISIAGFGNQEIHF